VVTDATSEASRYTLYELTGEPFAAGTGQVSVTDVWVLDSTESDGASGDVRGVALTPIEVERPPTFAAVTRNAYDTPFTRPVTVVGAASAVPGVHSTHVDAVAGRYSTT
jgi:hypothetical protein